MRKKVKRLERSLKQAKDKSIWKLEHATNYIVYTWLLYEKEKKKKGKEKR